MSSLFYTTSSVRPRRAAAARTNAAIDASLRVEAQTTRLGKMEENLTGWHMPTPPTPLGSEIPLHTHIRPSVYMWTMCSVGRSVVMTD